MQRAGGLSSVRQRYYRAATHREPSRAATAAATNAQRRGPGSARLPCRRPRAPRLRRARVGRRNQARQRAARQVPRARPGRGAQSAGRPARARRAAPRGGAARPSTWTSSREHTRDGEPRFRDNGASMLQPAGWPPPATCRPAAEGANWSCHASRRMRDFGQHRDDLHDAWQVNWSTPASNQGGGNQRPEQSGQRHENPAFPEFNAMQRRGNRNKGEGAAAQSTTAS